MGRHSAPRPFLARLRRARALRGVAAPAVTAAALGLAAASHGVQAQAPVRLGVETRTNTYTLSHQREPSTARAADGDYVVVWESAGQDGSYAGVYHQRYNAAGVPQGPESRVNTHTTGRQSRPVVAMDADGDYVVVWQSDGQEAYGSGDGVYAQRYSAAGVPQGAESRVNTYTTGFQGLPSVAAGADGGYVVAWQSQAQDGDGYGVYARRYSADGTPRGAESRVNTHTTGPQAWPAVAAGADGGYVVAWQSQEQDGSGYGVYHQRYGADGAPQGPERRVNTHTTGGQQRPSLAVDADGDYVVAWESDGQEETYGGSGVYARRYGADGTPQGAEAPVNTYTTDNQSDPSVAVDADGDYVVAWQSDGQDGAYDGVYARRFGATGEPQGAEVHVNTYTTGRQTRPAVAVDAGGEAVVVWQSNGQDGSGDGVYHQRYTVRNRPVATTAPGLPGPETGVNTYTVGIQTQPATAMDAAGAYVVVWQSLGQDGGIYHQRYGADGTPQGPESRVNTSPAGIKQVPAVAMSADGAYVVVWQSPEQDGSGDGVYARRYSAAGVPQGTESRVNTTTLNDQQAPAVAMDAEGDYVVVWQSQGQEGPYGGTGVYQQRYAADGTPQGVESRVNTYTTGNQGRPSVAMDQDGDYVVAWQSDGQDGAYGGYGVYHQRFGADGTPRRPETRVNTSTLSVQRDPAVAMSADGAYVVAWQSRDQDGSLYGVYHQRYNADGVPQGGESPVNTYTTGQQLRPTAAMDVDGDYVVAWESYGQDGHFYGVYAQRFGADGNRQSTETAVNATTTSNQQAPAVAMDAAGDAVVVWTSLYQDGSADGVYARRFARPQGRLAVELRGAEGWRQLAAPAAAATVGDVLGPLWTQGFPGADAAGGQPNVYRYTESAAGGLTAGYVPPASADEAMGVGRGYFAYVFADDDQGTPGQQGGFPKALLVVGDVSNRPVALGVTYTDTPDPEGVDGWNMVGNPYRESIDWDLAVRADVASSAYVYDPTLPGYRVWNGVVGDLADGVITALQGFWVKAMDTDASGAVTPSAVLSASAQVPEGGAFYGRGGEGAAAGVLALRVAREAGGYGREGAAFVSFEAGAAAGLDACDAYLLDPMAPTYTALYTRAADGTALAVQALPEGGSASFPLEVAAVEGGAPAGGLFTLAWDAPTLAPGTTARLLDAATGAVLDLTAAGTYAFALDGGVTRAEAPAPPADLTPPAPRVLGGDAQSLTGGRFTVVIDAATTGTEAGASAPGLQVAPNPLTGAGVVRYVLPEAGRVRVAVYDVLGREVAVLMDGEQGAGRHTVALNGGALAPGAYVVRLTAGETGLVRRVTVAR